MYEIATFHWVFSYSFDLIHTKTLLNNEADDLEVIEEQNDNSSYST